QQGVRRVDLGCPVDLTGGVDRHFLVWILILLRECTSWGIVVDWTFRPGEYLQIWQRLNHICPPSAIIGQPDAEEIVKTWRETFYLCKCVYRRGPGFVEVRDRRAGLLSRFVIDDPDYLAAVDALLPGAAAAGIPRHVLADFITEGLAG